ncbi:MAG: Uma2 family endonuclease [Actinomycetota bacterium]|nr:Uma2 family endonuclease [Actinomycetota bacterium]
MEAVTTLPWSRALQRADLARMPDDGHRYELVDGTLIVTPAPSPRHQTAVLALARLLSDRCPTDCQVFVAPLEVVLADDTVLQPDVIVARRADLTDRDLPAPPVLAVEVTSPSTRRVDLTLKRSRYEAVRCPSFWVVDPDAPSLTARELRATTYEEVAHVVGEQRYDATTPYEVTVCPAQLIA